jgi:hypothetical protein
MKLSGDGSVCSGVNHLNQLWRGVEQGEGVVGLLAPETHLDCSPSCIRVPALAAPKHAIKGIAELAVHKQRLPLVPAAAADCSSLHLRCCCMAPLEAAASGAAAP